MICAELSIRYLGVLLNSRKLNLVSCEPQIHQIKKKILIMVGEDSLFGGQTVANKNSNSCDYYLLVLGFHSSETMYH